MLPHFGKLLQNLRQRPWHALLAFGGFALLALGVGIPGRYAWSYYQLRVARQDLERQDLRAAYRRLEWSLSAWSRNARAQFLAAQTARRLEAHAEAERLLLAYEQRHRGTAESALEWLLLGVQQGDYAGQERFLQSQVDRDHPAAPLILEALAKGYQNTLRSSDMLGCADQLLQRQPTDVLALIVRGKGWESLRSLDKAREDFQRALELAPTSFDARLGLAETLNRLGHTREALGHYEALRQQQPGHPTVLLGLARCSFDSCELERAEHFLDALLAEQPDHVTGLVERARLDLHRGRLAEAEARLGRAVILAPWHREAQRLLQMNLEMLGKLDALDVRRQHLEDLKASDVQAARLRLRLRQAPRDPALRCEIGTWCLTNGEEQAGMRWICTALLVDPGHAPAHQLLADYFERTGQPVRAAQHRQQAKQVPASLSAGSIDLLCQGGLLSLPRSGCTAQPRVAQRTLGEAVPHTGLPRRGCTRVGACLVQPLRGRSGGVPVLPRVRCATLGCAVQPLRGKESSPSSPALAEQIA